MKTDTTPDAIAERHQHTQDWLGKNHPEVFNDQKHLDHGTVERAYWHYGYMVALRNILKLMEDSECQTNQ